MKNNFDQATLHLRQSDPVLAHIIKSAPPFNLPLQRGYYKFLVKAIMYQQLAGPAARTIFNRFKALYPGKNFPSAQDIIKTSDKKVPICVTYPKTLSTAPYGSKDSPE